MSDEVSVTAEQAALNAGMSATFEDVFPTVMAEEWKTFDIVEAIAFRNMLEAYVKGANLCRETFDKQVWKGHENGSVSHRIESIRTKSDGEKPGRKATVKTAQQLLEERLSK